MYPVLISAYVVKLFRLKTVALFCKKILLQNKAVNMKNIGTSFLHFNMFILMNFQESMSITKNKPFLMFISTCMLWALGDSPFSMYLPAYVVRLVQTGCCSFEGG